MKKIFNHFYLSILGLSFWSTAPGVSYAQINLVPNGGFEVVTDCDLDYGDAPKAAPWQTINAPIATPDLFHSCSESTFFTTPISGGGQLIDTKAGEGMVGLVNTVPFAEERIYARLVENLPLQTDIYVAYSIRPRERSGDPDEILCYSNTQSLAFSDIQFQALKLVLQLDTILTNAETWTQMQTCYLATGDERLILLGNYKTGAETLLDCGNPSPFNFTYFYVDEVIVSPFDVVPDTLFICGDEEPELDASFYDLPIQWSDGWIGPVRNIEEEGFYTVYGDVGDCFLSDEMVVIRILDELEPVRLSICEGDVLTLEAPVAARWPNGAISPSYQVNRPGEYRANLLSTCGEKELLYIVEAADCAIRYYVPNAFSPNDDGINDQLEFFFYSEYAFTGTLSIYDRWGSQIYSAYYDGTGDSLKWDGNYKGQPLNTGVFVWVFTYISTKDNKSRVIHAEASLLR